jgi:hypothetical protein
LEQATTAGSELFVPLEVWNRAGPDSFTPAPINHDCVPLDWLVELVAERIAVNLAATTAELAEDKKPARKAKVAA